MERPRVITMTRKLTISVLFSLAGFLVHAQVSNLIPLPENFEQEYPRLYITQNEKVNLEKTIEEEARAQEASRDLTLWYTQPATDWTEALPLGNGRLGAWCMEGLSRSICS
jgi:hypothetical protein